MPERPRAASPALSNGPEAMLHMTVTTPTNTDAARGSRGETLWTFLTFERLFTGQIIHLVYWAGLGVIVIGAFSVVGASIGVAVRDPSLLSILLAIPVLVIGLLIVAVFGLIWRAFCEFYVTLFRISDDLTALRKVAEHEAES